MQKTRILVVDDEPHITRELQVQLEETGRFEVRTANSGHEALQAIRAFTPDIAILDVGMPDLDGGELKFRLRQIKKYQHLPVIFLTAIIQRGETNNKDLYVEKPINLDRIIEVIDQQVAGRRHVDPEFSGVH